MDKSKQLKLGVVLSYLSTGINIVVQLVYTPLMLRLLGQSEYGLYTLVASIVSYLSLFSLSFTASYTRFYTKYKEKKDREGEERLNGMFLTIFLVMAVLALVCGMVLAQFPKQVFGSRLTIKELDRAQVLMRILVVNIALTFLTGLLESIITAHECFVFQRIVVLVSAMMNPFICLPFLLMGHTSVTIVVVTTIISVVKLVVDAGYCLRRLHIRFRFDEFDVGLLKEIANFNFFILLSLLVDQVNWSVDKFILGHVSGTKAVAVYGVGAQINMLFQLFATAISSVFVPRVNQIAAQNRGDTNVRLTTLLTKVGRMQCLVLFLFSSGLIVFGRYFITNIYSTPEYAQAYPVALLLIVPGLISLIQNLGVEIQRAVNKHRFMAIVYSVMAVGNVIISIPLAMWMGPVGSALGTAISLVLVNGLAMNIYYRKKIGLDIPSFWKSILSLMKGMIPPAIFGAVIMKMVTFDHLVVYFGWILLYTVVYCASMWLLGMNADEKSLVKRILSKLKRKA